MYFGLKPKKKKRREKTDKSILSGAYLFINIGYGRNTDINMPADIIKNLLKLHSFV